MGTENEPRKIGQDAYAEAHKDCIFAESVAPAGRCALPFRLALGVACALGAVWLLAMAAAPVLFCLKLLGLI
jgi:hypothetical protein